MATGTYDAAPSPDPAITAADREQCIAFMDLLSHIYLQHGLPDKAAVLLAARDVLAPDDARALLSLALALVRADKPAKALQTLERLALLGAMGAEFHLIRAQALQALDRAEEAAGAMRAYVAMAQQPAPSFPFEPATLG